ncbi:hypothetical protein KUCAC02_012247 [Chaenocephalus aceratus]|uniref:Uncharacterized protein n=1 Tax=Chaenocephalus aceratus TaxID=36190 RepID=A0ACB9XBM9_CHAAC|nr:hypothetical protein KUCAC02_012247 [Chaenocephalus aceratus]
MGHHFSADELSDNMEIVQTYRLHISQDIPLENLSMFYNSYDSVKRFKSAHAVYGLLSDNQALQGIRRVIGSTSIVPIFAV